MDVGDRLTQQDYAGALTRLASLRANELRFLRELHRRPNHAGTADEMAAAMPDVKQHPNHIVGLLGSRIAGALDLPDRGHPVVVSWGYRDSDNKYVWTLREPFVRALLAAGILVDERAPTLSDELLRVFKEKTDAMPGATDAERLVLQRVGQDVFRKGLLKYWRDRCAITGLAVPNLLRASHIRPWVDCETDAERLDIFNGLLLAPHLDAAFDQGFITVNDDGAVIVSPLLPSQDQKVLGLDVPLRVAQLEDGHRRYLAQHRKRVFKNGRGPAV